MKVLERKPWSIKTTCPDCHSKLEVESEDIVAGRFGSMGDYETEYYCVCAVCRSQIIIKDYRIPWSIREPALDKMQRKDRR